MDSADFKALKKQARQQAKAGRAALTEEQKVEFSAKICETILAMPAAQTAQTIAAYAWMGDEVRLDVAVDAWRARGTHVLFPCSTGNRVMYFHELGPDDKPDWYLEPGKLFEDPDAENAVPPSEFDLVIIPGVAFDNQRNRCGYGGGYYDTLLEQLEGTDCAMIAVAFDEQFVEQVPVGEFDRPMPMIVTQSRILSE